MLYYERQAKSKGFKIIIGIDEVGRGPLAGPVVASAVVLKKNKFRNRIDDSKKLTALGRNSAFEEILKHAEIGLGVINEKVIDEVNILCATRYAMEQAVTELIYRLKKKGTSLKKNKVCLLVDGNITLDLPYYKKNIIQGDRKSLSCAAASIVAKVMRDRMMSLYHKIYPQYGFLQHKGYATKIHYNALARFGPSPIHRYTFRLTS